MTKQVLLEYLTAVCDAENAIYSCNEIVSALDMDKKKTPRVLAPSAPQRTVYSSNTTHSHSGSMRRESLAMILGVVAGGLFLYLGLYLCASIGISKSRLLVTMVVLAVAFIIAKVTYKQAKEKLNAAHKGRLDRKMESQIDMEFQSQMKEYDNQYAGYLKAKEVEEGIFRIIDQNIAQQRENIARLSKQLAELYQRNIIYDSFRNLIAVNAIREYLAMGICDTLDGPNGAYAQYMQDVRVNRICTSIDEMKRQLMNSLNGIASTQGALLYEMKTTNSHVQQMQESISTSFRQLEGGLSEYQRIVSQGLSSSSAQLTSLNNSLSNVQSAVQASAHNQYIAAKEANIQGYLLRMP